MANRRTQLVAYTDRPDEVESARSWLAQARDRLTFVSEDKGCGCCLHIWDIEGPVEVLRTIPASLRTALSPVRRLVNSKLSFMNVGVVMTVLGVFFAMANHGIAISHGVVYWTGSTSTLFYAFPLCSLIWAWPPMPQAGATIALFVCMLAHWPMLGWALDCWLGRNLLGPRRLVA